MGPNTASHGGGARASTWELPEEEEIFLKRSTRSWPDLSPLSPHPHDRLQFNGTQAWDSAPHKLAKTSALKNQLRAHGLNIGFELAATKKNALVPEFGDRHNLSKLSCGKACSVRKIRMTGYSWRGQVTRNKCERKCETPNEIGVDCSRARDGVDRHMCGRNANDWLDSRMERRTDAEEHESKPAQKRRIISREWGKKSSTCWLLPKFRKLVNPTTSPRKLFIVVWCTHTCPYRPVARPSETDGKNPQSRTLCLKKEKNDVQHRRVGQLPMGSRAIGS